MIQTPSQYLHNKEKREQVFFTINQSGLGMCMPKPDFYMSAKDWDNLHPLGTKIVAYDPMKYKGENKDGTYV